MGFWSWLTGRAPAARAKAGASPPVKPSHEPTAPTQPALVLRLAVPAPALGEAQVALALALLQRVPPSWSQFEPNQVSGLACVAALDAVLREPGLDDRWLPRAASLVPQLMSLLRQPEVAPIELENRVARDVLLSAEVLQVAAGAHYASRGPVRDLRDALARLGHSGLQRAMSRVVLRPLFKPETDPTLAPLQTLLQRHVDWQADALADGAVLQGLDAFDGYLAGLLHGAGWQALLRIVSAAGAWSSVAATPELAQALASRAHRLFGRAASGWALSPAFAAFALQAEVIGAVATEPLSLAWAQLQPQSPVLA